MKYKTTGTCSQLIDFEVEGDTIKSVAFTGGCNGNLKGIICGFKNTSCPDQLACALEQYKAKGGC